MFACGLAIHFFALEVLHSGKTNKNAFKALIATEYVGVEVKWADNFEMGVSNKAPEFLKMNPIGKVPVLETPDGAVFESNAIARYVARLKADTSLFGSSPIEYGQIEQWIDFSSMEIDANLMGWLRPRFGHANYVASVEEASIAGLKRALGALNTYLASCTFLVGHEVEKLKDLCLKQKEEMKSLKNAILFPDVMSTQLQGLLEKQDSELKQTKQIIPTLQRQVTSLTDQLQCLAEDLAEVKADK